MLIEAALAFGVTFASVWRATDINEQTLNTLKRAYNEHEDALYELDTHKKKANDSLTKLVNRKKAILSQRMDRFLSVYQKIREIDFRPGEGIIELYSRQFSVDVAEELKVMTVSSMKPMSEKELVLTYLISPLGMGGAILEESKRNAQIANSQMQIARTLSAQTELLMAAVDAIGQRAEQLANLLSQFSVLFGKSIDQTEQIIGRNGTNRELYSDRELEILMNCVNLAHAIKAILDTPILNADGSVTEASLQALDDGSRRLQEFQNRV